jgi:hypothetical protein
VLLTSRSEILPALSPPVKAFSDEFADVGLANIGCLSDAYGGLRCPLIVLGLLFSETVFNSGTLSLPASILSVKGSVSDKFAGVNFYTGALFGKLLEKVGNLQRSQVLSFYRFALSSEIVVLFLTTGRILLAF